MKLFMALETAAWRAACAGPGSALVAGGSFWGWCGLGGTLGRETLCVGGWSFLLGAVTLDLQLVQRGVEVMSTLPAGLEGGEVKGPASFIGVNLVSLLPGMRCYFAL